MASRVSRAARSWWPSRPAEHTPTLSGIPPASSVNRRPGPIAGQKLLLGVIAAGPALAKTAPLTQLCSPGTNGGTLVNGVCVLPGAQVGQQNYEAFIVTSDGEVNAFTVVSGSLPPGMSLASNGTQGAILAGTPTQAGTFTFTVQAISPGRQTAQETYSITVTPAPPLTFCARPAPTAVSWPAVSASCPTSAPGRTPKSSS